MDTYEDPPDNVGGRASTTTAMMFTNLSLLDSAVWISSNPRGIDGTIMRWATNDANKEKLGKMSMASVRRKCRASNERH